MERALQVSAIDCVRGDHTAAPVLAAVEQCAARAVGVGAEQRDGAHAPRALLGLAARAAARDLWLLPGGWAVLIGHGLHGPRACGYTRVDARVDGSAGDCTRERLLPREL